MPKLQKTNSNDVEDENPILQEANAIAEDKTWCRKQEEPLQKTNHISEDKKNDCRRQNLQKIITIAEDKTHCRMQEKLLQKTKTHYRIQEEPLQKTKLTVEDKKNHSRRQFSLQNTRRTIAED